MSFSVFRIVFIINDIIGIVSSFIIAYYIRFYSFLPPVPEIPGFDLYLVTLPFILSVQLLVFGRFRLYDGNRFDIKYHYIRLIEGILFSSFIILAMSFMFRETSYSRLTFFIFISTEFLLLITLKIIILSVKKRLIMKDIGRENVLFIGSSVQGQGLADRLESEKYRLYNIIGYIAAGPEVTAESTIPCLGKLSDELLEKACVENRISMIIITADGGINELVETVERQTAQLNIKIRVVTEFGDLYTKNIYIEEFYDELTMVIMHSPLATDQKYLKEGFDLLFSLLILILMSPFMLLISLIIKLSSPRDPVIYKQVRTGADGKNFEMMKFRSMVTDAEDRSGPVWASKNDSRVTFFGRFLRKTSLDELPQFINVLRGEMSVVGPRPERPVFVEQFRQKYPEYLFRHKIKSGITGWAQINGLRGDTDLEKRLNYDLFYLENWSLFFDIKIIILTIPEVVFSKYAY